MMKEADRSENRINNLVSYIECLLRGDEVRDAYYCHAEGFAGLESIEIFRAFYTIQQKSYTAEEIIKVVPRVILATQRDDMFVAVRQQDPFLEELRAENQAMMDLLDRIRPLLREERSRKRDLAIVEEMQELRQLRLHFIRLQNIFFPVLEQKDQAMSGLSLLWAWHNGAERVLEESLQAFADAETDIARLNKKSGELFSFYASLPFKEERLLYSVADELLSEEDWSSMAQQSRAYPTAFDVRREVDEIDYSQLKSDAQSGVFSSLSGSLSFEQLNLLLNKLPVDFTVVDENDRVLYFNNSEERIFPRSPAIIGREVRNCHPPGSLDKVEDIINAFREGRESHARFWINMRGKKILIEYFALRDAGGDYRGVLEVSQNITEIQSLRGERRLREWQG